MTNNTSDNKTNIHTHTHTLIYSHLNLHSVKQTRIGWLTGWLYVAGKCKQLVHKAEN